MLSNTILVASGQCGNQVGYELLNQLHHHLNDDDDNVDIYFRTSSKSKKTYARAVCLDTEPKVIQSCMNSAKNNEDWLIDPKSAAYRHGGAGNNWALGYSMCSGEFLDIAINMIRREIELCDYSPTILSIHSMAGGTGSGLGAHLTEAIQHHFNEITRANISILPYHFGEVVVQNYNAVLSLSKISSSSDAVIMIENEVAHDLCKRMKSIDRPALQDINSIIAANLVPILLPKHDYHHHRMSSLADDIIHLCSHPGYRILDIKTVPQTSEASVDFTYDSWPTLIKSLFRMQSVGTWSELGLSRMLSSSSYKASTSTISSASSTSSIEAKFSLTASLGTVLTLRGENSMTAISSLEPSLQASHRSIDDLAVMSQQSLSTQRQQLTSNDMIPPTAYASYLSSPMKLCYAETSCNRYQHSASILSNSQAIIPVLDRSVRKAVELYQAQAYVHQYKTHGVDDNAFIEAFQQVGQIIENYRDLSRL